MNTSLLEQELAPLNAQIEQARGRLTELKAEMREAEAELETFSADRMRFDALRDACNVLERLDQFDVGQLFWGEVPEVHDPAAHLGRLRSRIAHFDEKIGGILGRQATLKAQINQRLDELYYLHDEVHDAHSRDARREEEFVIDRELSPDPEYELVMPWSNDAESERRFRRTMLSAMFLSLALGTVLRTIIVPAPVLPPVVEIPERLAMMVRKEHKKPVPVRKPKEEKKKEVAKGAEKEEKKQTGTPREKPTQERPKAGPAEEVAAPRKTENAGMLAFKDSFKDLLDETPTAKLGAEARLSNPATHAAGQAVASRSLVSMQGGGGSGGGYGNAAVSRNVGSGGIGNAAIGRSVAGGAGNGARLGRGGAGFAQVKSGIAGAGAREAGRPLSSGSRPARTDEEIQILFDRYKAALYRIYNTELRKDPTLRGKMVLRMTIEPGGAVSACSVESCNMNAPEFSAQIVDRVKRFNFGPKEGVPKTTILYPIDFLPAR